MRNLVETRVLEIFNDMLDDDVESLGNTLYLDLLIWDPEEGPELTKEVIKDIVAGINDEELLGAYTYLFGFNG